MPVPSCDYRLPVTSCAETCSTLTDAKRAQQQSRMSQATGSHRPVRTDPDQSRPSQTDPDTSKPIQTDSDRSRANFCSPNRAHFCSPKPEPFFPKKPPEIFGHPDFCHPKRDRFLLQKNAHQIELAGRLRNSFKEGIRRKCPKRASQNVTAFENKT